MLAAIAQVSTVYFIFNRLKNVTASVHFVKRIFYKRAFIIKISDFAVIVHYISARLEQERVAKEQAQAEAEAKAKADAARLEQEQEEELAKLEQELAQKEAEKRKEAEESKKLFYDGLIQNQKRLESLKAHRTQQSLTANPPPPIRAPPPQGPSSALLSKLRRRKQQGNTRGVLSRYGKPKQPLLSFNQSIKQGGSTRKNNRKTRKLKSKRRLR